MKKMRLLVLGLALGAAVICAPAQERQHFDILIRNGRVLDGAGNPDVRADVGIRADTIAAIGRLSGASAERTIDAAGLWVVPGFIDMHSHADTAMAGGSVERRQARNLLAQGITTVVFGADGRNSRWPIADEIAAFRDPGTGLNVVPMVGHGTVRGRVMGDDFRREARPDEVEAMKGLVRQGMEEGAWGLGSGLEYEPGRYSATEELIELARVVAEYDGFYYSHQRSQSRLPRWQLPSMVTGRPLDGIDGIEETIRIGRETGIRVVGSHIKSKGRSSWGRSYMDVMRIDLARREGHQVFLDQYPYETYNG